MAVEFLDAEPEAGVTFLDEQPATSGGVEFLDEQSPSESSVIGAAGREVVRETLPTVAGFKGGAWGAARGALWGSRLGPYGALGGGIIGGIAGFIGASAGARKLQELGVKAVVSDETYQGFESQVQADVEQHPWAVTAGSLVPWALHPKGRPNPAALGRAVEFVKGARAAKVAGTGIADYIKTEQGLANLPDFQRVAFGAGTQAAFGAWDSMKQGKFDAVDFGMRVMAGAILTGPSPIRAVVAREPGGPEVLAGLAEEAAKTPDIPIPEKVVPTVLEPPRIASPAADGAQVATPPPPIVPRPPVQTPDAAVEVPVERPPVAEPVAAPAPPVVEAPPPRAAATPEPAKPPTAMQARREAAKAAAAPEAKPAEMTTPELLKQFDDGEMSATDIYYAIREKSEPTDQERSAVAAYEQGYEEYRQNGMRMENFGDEYIIRELRKKPHRAKSQDTPQAEQPSSNFKGQLGYHRSVIDIAKNKQEPLNAAAVDAYGIKLPPGYVREGDRYVFKGEQGSNRAEGKAGGKTTAPASSPTAALPKDLAGAKPRYGYADKQFTLDFQSDVDRAAYIAAQEKRSKRDADYLAFAMKATGMTEQQVRAHGRMVRETIKALAKDGKTGQTLTVPTAERASRQPAPAATLAPARAEGNAAEVSIAEENKAYGAKHYPGALEASKGGMWRSAMLAVDHAQMARIPVDRVVQDLRDAGYDDKKIISFFRGRQGYGQLEAESAMSRLGSKEWVESQRAAPAAKPPEILPKAVEQGRTGEDLELKPEFANQYRSVAMLQGKKVIEGKPGDNHASIAERLGFPKDLIPGFIDKQGNFVYQFESDVPQPPSPAPAATEPVKVMTPEPPAAKPLTAIQEIEQAASAKAGFPIGKKRNVILSFAAGKDREAGKPYTTAQRVVIADVVDANTVHIERGKGVEEVKISRLSEVPAQAARRRIAQEVAKITDPAERKKMNADRAEFDKLAQSSPLFWSEGADAYINAVPEGPQRRAREGEVKKATWKDIAKAVGEPEADMTSHVTRAKMLPKLKEFLAKHEGEQAVEDVVAKIKATAEEGVFAENLPDEALVYKDGEWYQVNREKGVTNLEDGKVVPLADMDIVDVQGVLEKGAPGYDAAMKQFTKQEGVVPAPPGLTLEAATPEQLKAETFARTAKAKMAEKAAAPLAAKAAQEDLATGDMFERTSLFQPPVAETPERAATLKTENAKRQTTMFDDLEKRGKEGLDRLNKEGRLTTGADPERFFYLAEIGAAKIGRGVNNFARWSAEMVKEFGEWIREHLPQIWKQAQALHAEKTKPALPSEEHTVAEIQEAGRVRVERDAGLGGVDRESVAPPLEPKPTLPPVASYSAGGQQFRKALDANEATVRNFFGFSWTKARDFMAAAFRDVHRPITRRLEGMGPAGKRIITMFDRMAGASPKASLEIQDAIDSVMATLPKTPESGRRLDGIRLAKRVIEATELQAKRGETRTWPKGMSPESARAFLADEAKLLGPEKFKQYEDAAQMVSTVMGNQIVKLRDAGLLTPDEAKYILDNHKSYMPLEFLTKIDPDATSFSVLGKKVTVPDSGLQRLSAGDEGALISNWRYLLSQVVQRTDKRIAKNNLNRTLYDAAKPGNALGVVTDETLKQKAIALLQQGEMELGAPIEKLVRAYDTLPNGVKVGNVTQTAGENMQPIDVVVDGMTRRMWMHQDLVKYWTPPSHAEISDRVMRIMGWLSGATPVRALATGYNPEFAWRNLFMDAGYNWFRTNEYSTFLPQAFGQRVSDLRAVAKDAWNFGPETRAFINEGGSLDFLTQQGSLMRAEYEHPGPHHEFAEKAQRVLSKLNNTSEMMGRLATRRRAILNGSTPAEATLIARNILDFHKGGFVTKTLDRVGMPYLNAGFRAADGMAQSAVGNPREFAMKAGQLAVFASGLTYWAFRTSPKTMDSIPDREREGFWIIPLGDLSVMDATGKPRYLYMKFRKDQAARAMAAAAETTTERMMGRKVDGNRIWMGLTDFMPADPMSLMVPTHAAYVSYALNKDVWNKEDAWKGAKVSPEQEYTERTPQGYVLASKTLASLGIPASPERMKTAGQRVFPLNGWTALMGGAASWLLPDDKAVRQSFAEELMSAPGIRTVIGETRDYDLSSERLAAAKRYGIPLVNPDGTPRPSTRIADEIDAAQITINDRRQVLNRTLDNLMARTKAGQETFDSLNAWIQTIPDAAEQKRLHERVKSKLAGYMARVKP